MDYKLLGIWYVQRVKPLFKEEDLTSSCVFTFYIVLRMLISCWDPQLSANRFNHWLKYWQLFRLNNCWCVDLWRQFGVRTLCFVALRTILEPLDGTYRNILNIYTEYYVHVAWGRCICNNSSLYWYTNTQSNIWCYELTVGILELRSTLFDLTISYNDYSYWCDSYIPPGCNLGVSDTI